MVKRDQPRFLDNDCGGEFVCNAGRVIGFPLALVCVCVCVVFGLVVGFLLSKDEGLDLYVLSDPSEDKNEKNKLIVTCWVIRV